MKKIIRLSESELIRLVKKIIVETEPEETEPTKNGDSSDILDSAYSQVDKVSYKWGGMSPDGKSGEGFDCSGFVKWAFKDAGKFNNSNGELDDIKYKQFPRTAQGQYDNSQKVEDPQIGDLVFFTHGSGVQHVGIISQVYDTDFSMVHSSSSQGVSELNNVMANDYWGPKIVGFGRY